MQVINQPLAITTMETMVAYRGNIIESPDFEHDALDKVMSHFQSVAHIKALYAVLQSQTRHDAVDGLVTWAIGYGTALEHENLTKIATVLACMRR